MGARGPRGRKYIPASVWHRDVVVVGPCMLGGTPVPRLLLAPWGRVVRMGEAVPLPSPHVGVMGRVSGESGEGQVLVLTVELGGTGVVRRVGDVAAISPSGSLLTCR